MSADQWRPERTSSLDDAAAAVRSTGYDGPLDTITELAAGWDNTVFLVDDTWAFRLPRRSIALPGIAREIAWLPRLVALLPLDVPDPRWTGTLGEPPWPFWGARLLPGVELAAAPSADRVAVAREVGRFLRLLHDLPTTLDGLDPLPVDPMGRADTVTRAGRAATSLDVLVGLGIWEDDPATRELLAQGALAPPPSGDVVLSHGDLYARHVLVDPEVGTITGIIDWGDLCLALPGVDLAIAWSAFRGEARAALLDAYGPVDPDHALRARVFAVFSAANVAAYAHDIGDPVLQTEALTGLAGVAT